MPTFGPIGVSVTITYYHYDRYVNSPVWAAPVGLPASDLRFPTSDLRVANSFSLASPHRPWQTGVCYDLMTDAMLDMMGKIEKERHDHKHA